MKSAQYWHRKFLVQRNKANRYKNLISAIRRRDARIVKKEIYKLGLFVKAKPMPRLRDRTLTEKLLTRIEKYCDANPGAQSELARHVECGPARVTHWLRRTFSPSGEAALAMQEWINEKMKPVYPFKKRRK